MIRARGGESPASHEYTEARNGRSTHRPLSPARRGGVRPAIALQRLPPAQGRRADWEYDTETATLNFGKLRFEAPFVGSHAFHNNSWLWGWSNKHLKLTITNRALGDTVRMLVHRLGVHALAAAGFSLEPLLGPELTDDAAHVFGMILSANSATTPITSPPTMAALA